MLWGVKAHTTAKEKAQQNKQTAISNHQADEFAERGASQDGAEFAEMAKGADRVRKHRYAVIKHAASLHYDVEDLVDMEEITEEMKQRPT